MAMSIERDIFIPNLSTYLGMLPNLLINCQAAMGCLNLKQLTKSFKVYTIGSRLGVIKFESPAV